MDEALARQQISIANILVAIGLILFSLLRAKARI